VTGGRSSSCVRVVVLPWACVRDLAMLISLAFGWWGLRLYKPHKRRNTLYVEATGASFCRRGDEEGDLRSGLFGCRRWFDVVHHSRRVLSLCGEGVKFRDRGTMAAGDGLDEISSLTLLVFSALRLKASEFRDWVSSEDIVEISFPMTTEELSAWAEDGKGGEVRDHDTVAVEVVELLEALGHQQKQNTIPAKRQQCRDPCKPSRWDKTPPVKRLPVPKTATQPSI
jgi:hypothetical protein